ncbi:unnamed protein product [Prunus armeniaca]|uniref:Uncharacterized protein n=1 Tax=Prunus armeniaca TaxID=36596 RepID=A0A6J5XHN7_PRUAR|nr:unnamed protein product [Prunus armeniaca]CAB4313456.1 unnamed protein product [Prunus armeniaca]
MISTKLEYEEVARRTTRVGDDVTQSKGTVMKMICLGVCLLDMAPSWIGASLVDDLLGVTRTRLVRS